MRQSFILKLLCDNCSTALKSHQQKSIESIMKEDLEVARFQIGQVLLFGDFF